jgi:hypothetical protein
MPDKPDSVIACNLMGGGVTVLPQLGKSKRILDWVSVGETRTPN